ncbi:MULTISPECIES: HAD family hydrolase [Brucella/Ochrobactrum group]|uniref:HAD family phosphatase n=2 Tax=Ochrobactrum TaxID=528 RepID=A0A2P9HPV2_9HYPH|nr:MULTISPECIES: HAD family phosphatase [Brucella]MCI1001414.1 HAD family phosphatase [Ochrobactrum sp. C6C9]RRD21462.1 HAD family phosphatase [Brucellaceae bacterium VT-16-1752]WHT41974.1 HAD family phosphatase [Ochrobactrum sp. SSR]MDX4076344.1 HAD family phosphatase [Brucella sp. NBRC 113783]NNU63258.1 HAD family phosphatase [[Ochrobactrum] soli]
MSSVSPFDLVIFDCDGVLVDSEVLSCLAFERVYASHGMELPQGTVAKGIGMKQADIMKMIEDMTGHRLPDGVDGEFWPATRTLFAESLEPTVGIANFLRELPQKRCVASSSHPERIAFSLEKTGISHYFGDAVYSSSMVKRGKPAPDLFLFAADKMGVDPARCVVIEDSPFGVEGAIAAGMTAFGYTGGAHTYDGHAERLSSKGAHQVFTHWDDIAREILVAA